MWWAWLIIGLVALFIIGGWDCIDGGGDDYIDDGDGDDVGDGGGDDDDGDDDDDDDETPTHAQNYRGICKNT